YGYRRVAALLRDAGWQVNDKRVERLWRREGLKVLMKQPRKGTLTDWQKARLAGLHKFATDVPYGRVEGIGIDSSDAGFNLA
ncbi:HTH-like domain-containing protein, partial [Jannaschia faecimaris]